MKVFRFLHAGLAVILVLMGLKMIAANYFKVPTLAMLGCGGRSTYNLNDSVAVISRKSAK